MAYRRRDHVYPESEVAKLKKLGGKGYGSPSRVKDPSKDIKLPGIEDIPVVGVGVKAERVLTDANTWLRVAFGVLGMLALAGGVVLIAQATGVTAPAERAVGTVLGVVGPGGKVSKAAGVVRAAKGDA